MTKDICVEGTEDILNEFSAEDKLTLLKVASSVLVLDSRGISNNVVYRRKLKLDVSVSEAVIGINKALEFYYNNVPKGYTRIPGSTDIINREGVMLRFNRLPVTILKGSSYRTMTVTVRAIEGKRRYRISTVARVVAATFLPNPDNKINVGHKDGNFDNVNASNLYWTNDRVRRNTCANKQIGDNNVIKEGTTSINNDESEINMLVSMLGSKGTIVYISILGPIDKSSYRRMNIIVDINGFMYKCVSTSNVVITPGSIIDITSLWPNSVLVYSAGNSIVGKLSDIVRIDCL